jgi:hypothetical protein
MRRQTIKIELTNGKIEIDYSNFSISKGAVKARMDHLKGLIEAVLLAESDLARLSDTEATALRPAIEAQSLVCQFRIYEATEAALLMHRVIVGQANIADNGFPEIGPGYIDDV